MSGRETTARLPSESGCSGSLIVEIRSKISWVSISSASSEESEEELEEVEAEREGVSLIRVS